MPSATLSGTLSATPARLGAWCGVAAGLTLGLPAVVEAVTGETPATGFVLALSPALAIPLLVALHLRQAAVTGRFGAVAVTVNLVGVGLFGGAGFALNIVLVRLPDAVVRDLVRGTVLLALIGSAVVFAAGAVLFGVATVRAGVLPRVPAIAYTVALPVLALAAPLPDTIATSALHVVAGTTLVWLAMSVSGVGGPLAQENEPGSGPTASV
ncbi:MAG TPA: hypothetical protein VGP26_19115 [Actinophytocola sp.]|jgi:hypothetical protein|nr:hypothetical protein [Actinophytocola sp.]